jgi:hypothetical protein
MKTTTAVCLGSLRANGKDEAMAQKKTKRKSEILRQGDVWRVVRTLIDDGPKDIYELLVVEGYAGDNAMGERQWDELAAVFLSDYAEHRDKGYIEVAMGSWISPVVEHAADEFLAEDILTLGRNDVRTLVKIIGILLLGEKFPT